MVRKRKAEADIVKSDAADSLTEHIYSFRTSVTLTCDNFNYGAFEDCNRDECASLEEKIEDCEYTEAMESKGV